MYREPAEYVARLRGLKTDSDPLRPKINRARGAWGIAGLL